MNLIFFRSYGGLTGNKEENEWILLCLENHRRQLEEFQKRVEGKKAAANLHYFCLNQTNYSPVHYVTNDRSTSLPLITNFLIYKNELK
jgi:hypothetical protein